jgi:hypothetical protein
VKRTVLIKQLLDNACVLLVHGGKHDWYQNIETKISQPVSRHTEIAESLAKHIIKMLIG